MSDLRDANDLTEEEFLAEYKQKDYPKPSLTADMAIFRAAENPCRDADGAAVGGVDASAWELLLIRRGGHPYLGCWALPGGFVEPGESCDAAAKRELAEETGLIDVALEQFGLYSTPGRDPRAWTVSGAYLGTVPSSCAARAGDDAADARWFRVIATRADAKTFLSLSPVAGEGARSDETPKLEIEFEIEEQRFSAPRAHVVASTGFAFDHERMVADAYLRLVGR